MSISIVIPPSGSGGGATSWDQLTGKPAIATTIGDPGSDGVIAGEQAVRESLDKNKTQGFSFSIEVPEAKQYIITDDWPVDVNCTITEITSKGVGGGCTADWKIGSTSIEGASAISVTTSELETVPTDDNVLAEGDELSVTLSSVDEGCTEVRFTVKYERAN